MNDLARESVLPPALAMVAGCIVVGAAFLVGDRYVPVPGLLGGAVGLVPAGAIVAAMFVAYLFEPRMVWPTLGGSGVSFLLSLWALKAWSGALRALKAPLVEAMMASDPLAMELVRWIAAAALVAVLSAVIFLRTAKGRRPTPKRRVLRDGPYTAGWMDADERQRLFGGPSGLIVGQFPDGQLMRFRTDGHVATIAGTREGKGVASVIPNLIAHPGAVVVFDPKGENFLVTGRARRARGRKVYLLDPFRRTSAMSDGAVVADRLDLLKLLDPSSPEYIADATMFARLSATQRQTTANAGSEGHYFDQEGMDLIRTFLLFLVEATPRELATADVSERSMRALRELCTRDHERLLDLMGWMQHQRHIAHGVVAQTAEALAKMHFRQWGGIAGTVKEFTNWLADPAIADSLSEDEIDFRAVLKGEADLFFVVPFSTLQVYGQLPRVLIGMLLTHLQRRVGGREILVMVDELPQLGYVPPIEAAVFAAAGYGARLWLLIQDHDRFRAVYGRERAESIMNMMSLVQVFTVTGTAAKGVAEQLGEMTIMRRSEAASAGSQHRGLDVVGSRSDGTNVSHAESNRHLMTAEEIGRLRKDQSILLVRGHRPVMARRVRYFQHPSFAGWFDRNPLHDGAQETWEESPQGQSILAALRRRSVAFRQFLETARSMC